MSEKQDRSTVRILAATFLPHFSISLAQSAIGPLAPFIQESLAISRTQIGALTSAQFIGSTVMAVPAGTLVERLGVRIWIFLGPVILGLSALYFANITSFTQGMVAYLIAGFAFAFINPSTTKAIISGFPKVRRGTATGIKHTGVPAAGFLASATLPIIAISRGWELGMVIVGVVAIFGGLFSWLIYTERDINNLGKNATSPPGKGDFRKDFRELFHNSGFLWTSGLHIIFNMSQYIVMSYTVLYLVESLAYTTVYAGLIVAVMQINALVGRILWGLISDFLFAGKRLPTLQVIGFVTVAGLIGLGFLNETTPPWITWLTVLVAGTGAFGFAGNIMLLRAELAGEHLAATSTGLGMAISVWGMILGPPLFGFIVDTTSSYRLAWEITAGLTLGATILLRFIRDPANKPALNTASTGDGTLLSGGKN